MYAWGKQKNSFFNFILEIFNIRMAKKVFYKKNQTSKSK